MVVRTQTDLPLERDASSRYLPWIIAIMVYLAGLSLAGAIAVTETVDHWRAGIRGTMTVQVPPADPVASTANTERIAQALRETAGVARVRVLSIDDVRTLIRPWFNQGLDASGIALPRLIDVTLSPTSESSVRPRAEALAKKLSALVPGVRVVDHQEWLGRVTTAAAAARWFAIAIVVLIATAAMVTIIFAARTGLNIHRRVIDILHLMGARDRYISRQFERQAFWLGFKGGALGTLGAALTVLGTGQALNLMGFDLSLAVLEPRHWLILLVLPLAVAIVARVTARITVLRTLAKMS